MPAKLRRSIDSRTSSFAREIAKHAAKDPRLRLAVVNVSLACTGLANQIQQIAASCANAQHTFATVFPEDNDARDHAVEMFENLGKLIMHSTDGPLTEAMETLIVVAIHAAASDNEARVLSAQAQSLGLDTADIALDEDDLPRHPKTQVQAAQKAPSTSLCSSDDRLRIEAVAQVAITRHLPIVGVEADGTKLVLVGYTEARSRAERLCELDCDFAEAQRIVVIVTRIVERGLA